jgi:hypothetical protein
VCQRVREANRTLRCALEINENRGTTALYQPQCFPILPSSKPPCGKEEARRNEAICWAWPLLVPPGSKPANHMQQMGSSGTQHLPAIWVALLVFAVIQRWQGLLQMDGPLITVPYNAQASHCLNLVCPCLNFPPPQLSLVAISHPDTVVGCPQALW